MGFQLATDLVVDLTDAASGLADDLCDQFDTPAAIFIDVLLHGLGTSQCRELTV